MATDEATTIKANPLTEHDLEHRSVRLQLFVLRQLVLRLYADQLGEAMRDAVRNNLAQIQEAGADSKRHPAEQALLLEETAEVFADIDEHMDLMLAGAL